MAGTILRAAWVVPVASPPIRDGEVAVSGGRVVAVGRELARTPAAEGFSYADQEGVIAPGLVNAHAHLVFGPAYADLARGGMPFHAWIAELIRRRTAMSDADQVEQARASARLMLATGTTAVADVASLADTIPVLHEYGLQGRAYHELTGVDTDGWSAARETYEQRLAEHPGAGISPHTLYTLGDGVTRDLAALARRQGRRLHPHLAETAGETEFVFTGTGPYLSFVERFGLRMELAGVGSGRSPTRHLDHLGGLGPDVHVAHGVHVDAEDRKLLRDKGSAVALCTRSNAILGAGEAPVAAYRREGSPVAVGTDSLASCPDLDLLAELRALERLALDQGTDRDGLSEWLVRAATTGGAEAVGIDAGTIVPGARADLVLVEGEGTDPYAMIVTGRATATYLAGVAQ